MNSKTVKAYFEAYAAGGGDGPNFAKVEATPEFLARLRKLAALCSEHRLSEVRKFDAPEIWGPGNIEGELCLVCGELVVTSRSFWFVDVPKHANNHIETRAQDVEDFCKGVESAADDEVLYFGEDVLALEERVAESDQEATAD